MAACPNCGTELNADFGMIACPSCRAISVIDMDGNVQLDVADAGGPPAGLAPSLPETEPPVDFGLISESMEGDIVAPQENIVSETPAPEASFGFDSQDFMGGMSVPSEDNAFSIPPEPQISTSDMSDVADFGNSEESLGKDGLFLFDVIIEGIDTKELRESVRESLDDSRFLWDVQQIMSTISKGTLTLRQLNPVKATIVVNRLKGLPLEIRWAQNTIIRS